MNENAIAHRPWLRFYLAGFASAILLALLLSIVILAQAVFNIFSSKPIFWNTIHLGVAMGIATYFVSLLFFPFRVQLFGSDFKLTKLASAFFLIAVTFITIFDFWDLITNPQQAKISLRETGLFIAVAFGSTGLSLLTWSLQKLSYKWRPIVPVE